MLISTSQTSTAPVAVHAVIAVPKSCKNVCTKVDVLPGQGCGDDTLRLWRVMNQQQLWNSSPSQPSGGQASFSYQSFFTHTKKEKPSLPPDNELNCVAEMVAIINIVTRHGPFRMLQDWWRFPDPGGSGPQR